MKLLQYSSPLSNTLLIHFLFLRITAEDRLIRKRRKVISTSLVKLVVELDPVETQRVQESREAFHADENGDGEDKPAGGGGPEAEDGGEAGAGDETADSHLPEHLREL